VGVFLDNLITVLDAITPGLDGVALYSAAVDDLSAGTEAIVFAVEAQSTEYEYPTIPAVQAWETYNVEGRIWIVKPGAGETVIKAARDRALALLEQVHDKLASYATTAACLAALGVDDARITSWALEQYSGDGYRDCRIAFTIAVRARFTPA
jgi:hypothetical protein